MLPVDPHLISIARQMQAEKARPTARSGGVLAPALVLLAEFRYLGYSLKYMHEFATRSGLKISYAGFCAWMKTNIGPQSGLGSKAAEIVQDAVNQGAYTSPYFPKQDDEFSRTRKNEGGGDGTSPLPPVPTASGPPLDPVPDKPAGSGDAGPSPEPSQEPELSKASEPDTNPDSEEEKKRKTQILRDGLKKFDSPFKRIQEQNLNR